jgi:hypothetical protein
VTLAAAADKATSGIASAASEGGGGGFRGGLDEGLMEAGDDEEEDYDEGAHASRSERAEEPAPPLRGLSLAAGDPAAAPGRTSRIGGAPRLRTRLFAARSFI